jgi:exodeoxyribonuclease VII small subunit
MKSKAIPARRDRTPNLPTGMSHSPPDCPTFEEALENLEAIVHDLEEGQIGLAQALAQYEQGVKLLKQCFNLLEGAERKIELLSGFDPAGNPVAQAFDDESSMSRNEKGETRSRRPRAARPKAESTDDAANVDSPPSLF